MSCREILMHSHRVALVPEDGIMLDLGFCWAYRIDHKMRQQEIELRIEW